MKRMHLIIAVILFVLGLSLTQSLALMDGRISARVEGANNLTTPAKESRASITPHTPISLRANEQGTSRIALGEGRNLATRYTGAESRRVLENGAAQSLALAAGDLDEDGTPDLISAYASDEANLIVIHRGNVDAIYENAPEALERKARGEFSDAPFLSPARVFELPARPDFIGVGDFDADGHLDVVVASLGSQKLYWLPGDGHGGLGEARAVELNGRVTAMTVGEINRADGLADVVVGVADDNGARLLVFEGAEGALKSEPEALPLPHAATSLALGQLDDSYEMELAAAAGNQLLIVHGRDRKLSLSAKERASVKPAQIDTYRMPFQIASIAVGDFTGDARSEVALLADDGAVRLLERDAETTGAQASAVEAQASSLRLNTKREQRRNRFTLSKSVRTLMPPAATLASGALAFQSPQQSLVRARVSVSGKDDLLFVNRAQRQVQVITGDMWNENATSATRTGSKGGESGADASALREPQVLDADGEVSAVLPMRLNKHAVNSLVILKRGGESPLAVIEATPSCIITVNSSADTNTRDSSLTLIEANLLVNGNLMKSELTAAEQAQVSGTPTKTGLNEIRFSVISITRNSASVYQFGSSVTIDGTTAGRVEISNSGGIRVECSSGSTCAGGSAIRGLTINRFSTSPTIGISLDTNGGGNIVEGNYIGLDATGANAAFGSATSGDGVYITQSANNTIGGTAAAARNVIVTPGSVGARIASDASGNKIQGNYIGTDISGTKAIGNGQGVQVSGSNNTIGGTESGAGNIIAFSKGYGVLISGTGNAVRRNSIFGNSSQAVFNNTSNGAKRPTLNGTTGTLSGSPANTAFTIEFFTNDTCGGTEQAKTFISDTTVQTDASGNATFNIPGGQFVTATANASGLNTSTISNCIQGTVTDALSVANPQPTPGQLTVSNLMKNGLQADVTYLLASVSKADLVLRVFDQNGNRVGSSQIISVTRANPPASATVTLQIPGSSISLFKNSDGTLQSTSLKMYALLIDSSSNVIKSTESASVNYTLVDDTAVKDSIAILDPKDNPLPNPTLVSLSPGGVNFLGIHIQYTLVGDPIGGGVMVAVQDVSGSSPKVLGVRTVAVGRNTTPKIITDNLLTFTVPRRPTALPHFQIVATLLGGTGNTLAQQTVDIFPKYFIFIKRITINGVQDYPVTSGKLPPFNGGNETMDVDYSYVLSDPNGGFVQARVSEGNSTLTSIEQPIAATGQSLASGTLHITYKASTQSLDFGILSLGLEDGQRIKDQSFDLVNGLALAEDPPMADYQLNNSRNSSQANPALTALLDPASAPPFNSPEAATLTDLIAPGTSTANSFITDNVDGAQAIVLRFPTNNGLALSPTTGAIANDNYTIIFLSKFDQDSVARRLLDFKNGTSDNGLYAAANNALSFRAAVSSSGAAGQITANKYVQIALTRDAATKLVTGYVNGSQQFQFTDTNGDAVIDANNTLRFFQDNLSGGTTNEASAGTIARLRLYGRALSADEISALDREPVSVQLSSATYSASEGDGSVNITVTRTGATTLPATVDYQTADDTASQKSDYTAALGTLSFAAGETSKTFKVLLTDNGFVDGDRTVNLFLTNPRGMTLSGQSAGVLTIKDNDTDPAAVNPIDNPPFYVQMHYHDFLNREPDTAGLNFWVNQITGCNGDANCIDIKRQNVSAAYFLSREFQETGFFVIKMQRAAFGKVSNDASKRISYLQFVRDAQAVGQNFVDGQTGADQILDQNKTNYAQAVVSSSAFISKYPTSLSASAYVDALFQAAGVQPSSAERQDAITAFGAGDVAGRAAALRKVAESDTLKAAEFRAAFVLLQYFGYLRRNPTDAPDTDDSGYQFWLGKLNRSMAIILLRRWSDHSLLAKSIAIGSATNGTTGMRLRRDGRK